MSVLVCLALVTVLFSVWIKTVVEERRQVRAIEDRMQAEYLADSGLRRAAARLAADADYAGETWQVEAGDFSGPRGGTVSIEVRRESDEPLARVVRAVADFPKEVTARARRSKETKLILSARRETP